jgi:hypothetical protein
MSADKPARLLIYGSPGIGKTTLASEFPEAVFLQIEDGTPGDVEMTGWSKSDLPNGFPDILDALTALYEGEHQFRTIVIDSVTELQRLVFAETCARGDDKGNPKNNIEDFGYGKGYVYAQRVMQEIIDGLNALRNDRGMTVVMLAHSTVERFDDPETVSYDRYEIDLHGKLVGMIERDMDAILLLKKPVTVKTEEQGFNKERARADGGNTVFIHTAGRPAYVAKNRYGMPEKILYVRGKGFDELARYLPGFAAEAAPAAPAQTMQPTSAKKSKAA